VSANRQRQLDESAARRVCRSLKVPSSWGPTPTYTWYGNFYGAAEGGILSKHAMSDAENSELANRAALVLKRNAEILTTSDRFSVENDSPLEFYL